MLALIKKVWKSATKPRIAASLVARIKSTNMYSISFPCQFSAVPRCIREHCHLKQILHCQVAALQSSLSHGRLDQIYRLSPRSSSVPFGSSSTAGAKSSSVFSLSTTIANMSSSLGTMRPKKVLSAPVLPMRIFTLNYVPGLGGGETSHPLACRFRRMSQEQLAACADVKKEMKSNSYWPFYV